MECILCYKQHVGKAETNFNIRLNNHWKDVKKVNTMACKDFQQESHYFSKHTKFTIDQSTGLQRLSACLRACTYCAPKTLIKYTKKCVPKRNNDVCFTEIL